MPNWCNNNIEIIGPKKKVDALIEGAKKGEFINTLYPMPKALEDTQSTSDEEVMKTTTGTIGEHPIGVPNGIVMSMMDRFKNKKSCLVRTMVTSE